jgi:hypothetical protein
MAGDLIPFVSLFGSLGNEPFGSRPEPWIRLTGSIHQPIRGEAPKGRARGIQDSATRVQSESER